MSKPQSFRLRVQELSRDEVKAYLACAADFNPKNTEIEIDHDSTHALIKLTETTSDFELSLTKHYERKGPPPFIDTTKMQLGEWNASSRDGNAVAARALDIINWYESEIERLNTEGTQLRAEVVGVKK